MNIRKFNKKYLRILALVLFTTISGVITYILVPNPFRIFSPQLNKYPEIMDWCSINDQKEFLNAECNALLIKIINQTETQTCLDLLIMTNEKKLEKFSICENPETLRYSNGILNYKELMPITIALEYEKTISINKYSLKTAIIDYLPETYTQEVLKSDISEVLGIDRNSTTILNSFDFCPNPDILPIYIEPQNQYISYWNTNILANYIYQSGWNYSLEDPSIRLLFTCESTPNIGNYDFCKQKATIPPNLSSGLSKLNFTIDLSEEITDSDRRILKELSLIYDNMFLHDTSITFSGENVFDEVIDQIGTGNVPSEIICSTYKIYEVLNDATNMEYIRGELLDNIDLSFSGFCNSIIKPYADPTGIYLKNYFSNYPEEFKLLNRCMNITFFLKNNEK